MSNHPITELLSLAGDQATRTAIHKEGRAFTGGPNACAATASAWLRKVGLLSVQYAGTKGLSDVLIRTGWQRIDKPADVRAGDLVFTLDQNGNGKPDHVIIAVSNADTNCRIVCVDNQKRGEPHTRNLRKGWPWNTPMWYALRYEDVYDAVEGSARYAKLQHILGHLRAIYAWNEFIPTSAMHALNQFANHPFLDPVRHADDTA